MIINIFGKNVKISTNDDRLGKNLEKELSGYKYIGGEIDINISFVDKIEDEISYSNTPKIHKTFKNGFSSVFSPNIIKYYKENDLIKIDFQINNKDSFINKFRSIDYRSNIEHIGTIMHELIFVLMTFFDENLAPIHASSMKSKNGDVYMFGGTGGVGKTSLELLLCRELGFSFISDDIAIIDRECNVYPNLSYPKIYAYNTESNSKLEKVLLDKKSLLDKFQWKFFKKIKGQDRVRRSISPFDLFESVEINKNKIDKYFILHKTDIVSKITFQEINYNNMSSMTLDIIKNEYYSVMQHIIWHEYNSKLMEFNPILLHQKLYENWLNTYMDVLKHIECCIIQIPTNILHKDFLLSMKEKFKGY